ncbi:MAG: SRPBCC family protein [Actinomycetota bacterium]
MTEAKDIPELNITRIFDAPRDLVFDAWTRPEHLKEWFHPEGFTTPEVEVDLRAGGKQRLAMRDPEGKDYWSEGTYQEVVVPEKLVVTDALLDDDGNPMFEVQHTITFADMDGKTEVTVNARVEKIHDPASAEPLSGMEEGWKQTLDNLDKHLARA